MKIIKVSYFLSVTCECTTPNAGTVRKNEIKCGNETRHCSKVKECYATEKFAYGEWSDGCRIPGDLIIMSCKYCMIISSMNPFDALYFTIFSFQVIWRRGTSERAVFVK